MIKANLDSETQGKFYSGFFNISIGTERLLKICAIINHLLNNNLSPPSNIDLRNLGHDITALYSKLFSFNGTTQDRPKTTRLETRLLDFITEFAKSSRYYNLDAISGGKQSNEPISKWYSLLLDCWENEVSTTRRNKIIETLLRDLDASGNVGYMYEFGFDDHPMTTFDYYLRQIIVKKATPLLIYHIISLLRPAYEYLSDVCGTDVFNSDSDRPTIPYMYEFFPFLLSERSHAIRTKVWSRLF